MALYRSKLAFVGAVVMVASCSGAQPPIGLLAQHASRSDLSASPLLQRDVGVEAYTKGARRSWMAPDARNNSLLYVSSYGDNGENVYVYSYPEGKLKGTLTGFAGPQGECVDRAGDVFISNYDGADIMEYAHGSTQPIAILEDQPYSNPDDCSIDPTTGDLAVSNDFASNGHGDVAIYKSAQGVPQIYSDPDLFDYTACAYDNAGNLFVDGDNDDLKFTLAELPKSSTTFVTITLPKIREKYGLGAMQWDGQYIAIGNPDDDVVYQLQISGTEAKVVGSTPLTDGAHVDFFSIVGADGGRRARQSAELVGSNYYGTGAKVWKYPAGGMSVKAIGDVDESVGTAVSPARMREAPP